MQPPRLTAKELQRRYRDGDRNFANVDLSGESLRGMNLKDIDLSGADLSKTDIRGTRFVNAILQGTVLRQVRAGLSQSWLILHIALGLFIASVFSLIAAVFYAIFSTYFFSPEIIQTATILPSLLISVLVLLILIIIGYQGLSFKALSNIFSLVGGMSLVTVLSTTIVANGNVAIGIIVVLFAGVVSAIVSGGFAIASAVGITVSGAIASTEGLIIAVLVTLIGSYAGALTAAGSVAGAVAFSPTGSIIVATQITVVVSAAVAFIVTSLSSYVAWCALKGDEKFKLVRLFALALGSVGSTSFAGADLTGAFFTQAVLTNTSFADSRQRPTNLTKVRWKAAQKLDRARVGSSILQNPRVRELVVTLNGVDQDYANTNLRGANLANARLLNANFTGAILSEAVLTEADLQGANLTEASCIATDFSRAHFTGATLEAWNIESSTRLEDVICDYVYLLRNQQERRPNSGTFGPGEFTKLFQEVLDTIDLIFQNGVDWKAFVRTFNDVQEQYDNANLGVQTIENKGDGVVVVKLNAAPGADKPAIHQSFTEAYQLALAEAEARYKAQLNAKDEQIQDYRQQNANMQEVVKLLAQRPINVDVKATAESKAMQGDDNSRNIHVGGNATGNVFQTGDRNTASLEFQQVTLPAPEQVNIQAELNALAEVLTSLDDPITTGVALKLEQEAHHPNPDKSVVAKTLETGLDYARNLQGFAEAIDKLRPHVQNAAGWLGEHGHKLLPLVGLALL
jgi:uncharacterized protein YjbI with pentapeptide repeats